MTPSFTSSGDRSSEAGFIFRSELPVENRRKMLPFIPHAFKVKRSLDATFAEAGSGLLFYELRADFAARTFYVDSAWSDESSFQSWVDTDVHRQATSSLGPRVEGGTFEATTVD